MNIANSFLDKLNHTCSMYPTKVYGCGSVNFGRASWLQKADYFPIVSSISAVARVIISTLAFIGNFIRGDIKLGAKFYATNIARSACVIIPGLGNVIASYWDQAKGTQLDTLEKDQSNVFTPFWAKKSA